MVVPGAALATARTRSSYRQWGDHMKIAFIGLGNMGGGMAANLVKAGHHVQAYDLSEVALAAAKANGCLTFSNVREAVAAVDAVVSMLPNGVIVDSVYGTDVIGQAPVSALLLDCSTIDVATARKVAGDAAAAGYVMVDAPVSGGIAAANAGTLTFMVGGSDTAFARAEPILSAMGKAVIHAGDSGAGQAAKICNNMLLGASMIATCETFAMAEKLGLDLQTFYDISSLPMLPNAFLMVGRFIVRQNMRKKPFRRHCAKKYAAKVSKCRSCIRV